ncbi:MAG TPA: hypothetical protein VHK70_00230 [Burkholderiaceae bacterium]|nr:hypothetical protein [Burkholderiaceae bacterium]
MKLYAVNSEAALLKKITSGEVGEHPAYEHYLSALILEQTRAQVQAEMIALQTDDVVDVPAISIHLMLKEKLEQNYAERMTEPPRLAQDALTLAFDNGVMMEVRYFSNEEYSIRWSCDEYDLCVDTAPVHSRIASFPQHLHGKGNVLLPDDITRSGEECWKNFSRLLDRLLSDPLLEKKESVHRTDLSKQSCS